MAFQVEDIVKILLAILFGGLIGGEREARDKSAGFRTIILICLGATLFTMLSSLLSQGNDPARITANIVTGIGFLGAGAILREGNQISGLTTAASIWLSAAVGMAVGGGQYTLALIVTLATMIVLWVFPTVENLIDEIRHTRTYQILCHPETLTPKQLEAIFSQHGLKVYESKRTKSTGKVVTTWQVTGRPKAHASLVEELLNNKAVLELTY